MSNFPIHRPLVSENVQILANSSFQESCMQIGGNSLLDTPRLANLWDIAQASNSAGAMAEIGTYRGGGALHLTNACPNRKIYVFDPFSEESFEKLDEALDGHFKHGDFRGVPIEHVASLLVDKNVEIIQGYFPQSCLNRTFEKFSFIHLDVDVYDATINSLRFLFQSGLLLPKSYIVIDDFNRGCLGVDKALKEIKFEFPNIHVLPLFPSQGLIITE